MEVIPTVAPTLCPVANETSAQEYTEAMFLRTILMLLLVVISINITNLLKIKHFHIISESSIYVIVGLIIGKAFVSANHQNEEINSDIQLSSNFFYMVLLPPIIFEGGFTLQRVAFVRNIGPILLLALPGAIYSTVLTSGLMVLFAMIIVPDIGFGIIPALVFGSIISSTDPVSVLGMLPPSTDKNLYMTIFGESALNDAVAIILYKMFTGLAQNEDKNGNISLTDFFSALGSSVFIFLGSALVGLTIALIFAKMTKHVRSPEAPIFELSMFFVFAYSSYLVSDLLGLTGIIGIFFCGIGMAHYAYENLSKVTILTAKVVLRMLSTINDAFIFVYVGLGVTAFGSHQTTYNIPFIIAAVVTILISRTHVFWMGWVMNLYSKATHKDTRRIPLNHQIFLWFCGLRGAVSFSLGVQILGFTKGFSIELKSLIFGTTIMVVCVTVLGFGSFIKPMMNWLKLDESSAAAAAALEESKRQEALAKEENESNRHQEVNGSANSLNKKTRLEPIKQGSENSFDEYLDPESNKEKGVAEAAEFMETMDSGLWVKLYEIDKRYIKPFFTVQNKKTKRAAGGAYEGLSGHAIASDPELVKDNHDVRSIKNKKVFSAIDDDDSDDEIDKIAIGDMAEMIGIAGTTVQVLPSVTALSAMSNKESSNFRRGSITSVHSLKRVSSSKTSIGRRGSNKAIEMSNLQKTKVLDEIVTSAAIGSDTFSPVIPVIPAPPSATPSIKNQRGSLTSLRNSVYPPSEHSKESELEDVEF